MQRLLLLSLTSLTLSGCFGHDDRRDRESRREERHEEAAYRDGHGQAYRHARWHDEDVYRREDGRWYSRRNDQWVMRPEVHIE